MLLPRIFITSLILCMSMTWCHFDITFSIEDTEERRKKIERLSRKIGYHKLLMETSILTAADDCYGVADVTNRLYTIDKNFGTPTTYIGPTGVLNIEAITISVDGTTLYAMDDATWGTLNTTTGAFTAIGNVGTGNGPSGPHVFDDVDGLAVDARTGEYFGTERPFGDGTPEDYLFKLDPATGAII
ncbi:MAG: hypothetical protein KJO29_02960, partial [Bacteroidia bacterium]|nr:hypothetical protein [Bacteroidia bacterium]